jgi:putative flippase GtrA
VTGPRRRVTREIETAFRFAVVGAIATAVHIGAALALFLLAHANVWIANAGGFLASAGVSLLGQHQWVFESSRPLARTALPFLAVAAAGFAFNNLVVGTLSVGFAAPGTASLTVAALLTPPVTYAINRFLIFRPGQPE